MKNLSAICRVLLILFVAAIAGVTLICSAAFLYLSPNLPSVDVLRDVRLQTPLRVYTRDGELIGEFGEMRRTPVQLNEVPPLFIKAVLAAEDDRFYSHHGVDLAGLIRAAAQLVMSGSIQSGGSTITMQVAKNYFLSYERTFSRKFNEILLALQIERNLTKDQILELYLNKIFLGHRAYGVEAAAQVYYGRSINELGLDQWATIAAIPKAPSTTNPITNPIRAKYRRDWILGRMLSLGYINQQDYEEAVRRPVFARYHGSPMTLDASYVAEMARHRMVERLGPRAYTDGFRVYTTIDSRLQRLAVTAVRDSLLSYTARHGYRGPEQRFPADGQPDIEAWTARLRSIPVIGGLYPAVVTAIQERSYSAVLADGEHVIIGWNQGISGARRYINENQRGPAPQRAADVVAVGDVVRLQPALEGGWQMAYLPAAQAALVSLDADTGALLSLVGGFDFRHSKFNRITQARRQPGSSFKPFVYAAALAHGLTPATVINDAPIVFNDTELEGSWRPVNDTGRFYGPTPLRQGLYKSRNVVSIRVLQQIGISRALNYLGKFGFERDELPRNLSLALGSLSVPPLKVASGYAIFANGGFRVEPYLIERIEDIDGNLIFQANPATACRDCPEPEPELELAVADEEPVNTASARTVGLSLPAEPPRAERAIDAGVAYIMHSMMQDVVRRGTASRAQVIKRNDMAGKTGTTNGPTDAWFAGYAGGIVTTTWLGFDQFTPLGNREYASTTALPMWIDYMKGALQGVPERHFRQPENVVSLRIDPATGLRARPGQPDAIFELFTVDTAPTQEASPFLIDPFEPGESGNISVQDIF